MLEIFDQIFRFSRIWVHRMIDIGIRGTQLQCMLYWWTKSSQYVLSHQWLRLISPFSPMYVTAFFPLYNIYLLFLHWLTVAFKIRLHLCMAGRYSFISMNGYTKYQLHQTSGQGGRRHCMWIYEKIDIRLCLCTAERYSLVWIAAPSISYTR